MNRNRFFVSTALALCLSANVQASDIETNTARMQAMDKITGRVSEIDVPVNGLANFGTFSILVRKCVTRSPEETPENTAFVDVVDNYQSENPTNIFKGWMFSSTPALNAVEHPIYDVWLLKCYNKKTPSKTLTAEQLAVRDNIRMVRKAVTRPLSGFTLAESTSSAAVTSAQEEETVNSEPEVIRLQVEDKTIEQQIEPETASPETGDETFVSEGEEDLSSEAEMMSDNENADVTDNSIIEESSPDAQQTEDIKPLL